MLRANVRCRVRTSVAHSSGVMKDGGDWENWTFEAVDTDDNKVTFHLPDGQLGRELAIGDTVDLIVDVKQSFGKLRFTVRQINKVTAKAA